MDAKCQLCRKPFRCDNGRWLTTCECASLRPMQLAAACWEAAGGRHPQRNEQDLQDHIAALEFELATAKQIVTKHSELVDQLRKENTDLREQLTYQTDRAESFCTRLHEEEHRNEELRQRLSLREELAADPEMVAGMKRGLAYLRDYDKIVSELREPLWYAIEYIEELEQQLTYQTDRAESFCTRLHEEEQRNEELRQRCETMSNYLRTHDHRLHDAAMAAAKEH